jgi:hypothetical protein
MIPAAGFGIGKDSSKGALVQFAELSARNIPPCLAKSGRDKGGATGFGGKQIPEVEKAKTARI